MKIAVSFLDFMSATPISASNSQPCAQSLSCVQLFETSWTVACQAPLSMGFPRQEYWSGLPFPPPGNLPSVGIEPESPASPELADSLPWSQNTPQLISPTVILLDWSWVSSGTLFYPLDVNTVAATTGLWWSGGGVASLMGSGHGRDAHGPQESCPRCHTSTALAQMTRLLTCTERYKRKSLLF